MYQDITSELPVVHLHLDKHGYLTQEGVWREYNWSIRTVPWREHTTSVVLEIKVDGQVIADLDVYRAAAWTMDDEVQGIACAILWSRLRAIALQKSAEPQIRP